MDLRNASNPQLKPWLKLYPEKLQEKIIQSQEQLAPFNSIDILKKYL